MSFSHSHSKGHKNQKDDEKDASIKPFITAIKDKLCSLPNDKREDYDLVVYLESFRTVTKLNELLDRVNQDHDKISADSLNPFFEFLSDRGKRIVDTKAVYTANPNTKANQLCQFLLEQIEIEMKAYISFDDRTDLMKKSRGKILLPRHKAQTSDGVVANPEIQEASSQQVNQNDQKLIDMFKYATGDIQNRDQFIQFLLEVDASIRKDICNYIKLEDLIKIITNNEATTYDDFKKIVQNPEKVKTLYSSDGNLQYDLAIATSCISIYKKNRLSYGEYKTTFGAVRGYIAENVTSFFGTVPSLTKKQTTADNVQDCLVNQETLPKLPELYRDPNLSSVLNDGDFKVVMDSILKTLKIDVNKIENKATVKLTA